MQSRKPVLFAAIATVLLASTAHANDLWSSYRAEIDRQCPAKHLEWLAPAELRDALDDYKSHVSPQLQRRMRTAESRRCKNVFAGTTCDNGGDLEVAAKKGALPALTASVCGDYAICREQSDCDASENLTASHR